MEVTIREGHVVVGKRMFTLKIRPAGLSTVNMLFELCCAFSHAVREQRYQVTLCLCMCVCVCVCVCVWGGVSVPHHLSSYRPLLYSITTSANARPVILCPQLVGWRERERERERERDC